MKTISRRELFRSLAAAIPTAAAVLVGTQAIAGTSPYYTGNTVDENRSPNRFPNYVLTTHEGKKVRFYDDLIRGKIVLINFFYAECEKTCPPNTANLLRVQKKLGERVGRDIFFYSITLKPERDSVDHLAHYADMHELGPGWLLLTGKPAEIEQLRKRLGFVDPDPEVDKDTSNHIGLVLYGNDKAGRWSACPAIANPDDIVRSISWIDDRKG